MLGAHFVTFLVSLLRYRFHEVAALPALMHAERPLCENGDEMKPTCVFVALGNRRKDWSKIVRWF